MQAKDILSDNSTTVFVKPGMLFALDFTADQATFKRSGDDLIILTAKGNTIVLKNFFQALQNTEPPHLFSMEGNDLTSKISDTQDSLNGAPSSGLENYVDNSGVLLAGMATLGKEPKLQITTFQPDTETYEVSLPKKILPHFQPPQPPQPPTPPQPPIPPPHDTYYIRGVGYILEMNSSLHFEISLFYNKLPVSGFGRTVSITPAAGFPGLDPTYYSITLDAASGNYIFTLTPVGLHALMSSGQDLYQYFTITVDDQSYIMQQIVTQKSTFISSIQDSADTQNAVPINGNPPCGETHHGKYSLPDLDVSGAAQIHIQSTEEITIVNLENTSGSGLLWGSSLNLGQGTNSITLAGQTYGAKNSTITTGNGNNALTVMAATESGFLGSAITMGDGNNTINITAYRSGLLNRSTLTLGSGANVVTMRGNVNEHASAVSSSSIIAGNGGNKITIENFSYGFFTATLTTGDGDDTLTLTGIGEGAVFSDSNINLGNGNNVVNITADFWGIQEGSLSCGNGDDYINITATSTVVGSAAGITHATLDAGDGNNTISVSGHIGMDIRSMLLCGDGDDVIAITASTSAVGVGAHIDAGNDNNTITLTSMVDTSASIATGTGNDQIVVNGNCQGIIYTDSVATLTRNPDGTIAASWTEVTGGNDTVRINGLLCDQAQISTGGGDDHLTITGQLLRISTGSLNGGNGIDHLALQSQWGYTIDSTIIKGFEFINLLNDGDDDLTLNFMDLWNDNGLEEFFIWGVPHC